MDEDSRIMRLREYIQLYLRRTLKENNNERFRDKLLFEKITSKFRESKISSEVSSGFRKNKQNKQYNSRNQERDKIKEEIGRNYHTPETNGFKNSEVFDDLKIEVFPYRGGYMASISNQDDPNNRKEKIFPTEEEANLWIRNNSLKLSKKFTQ